MGMVGVKIKGRVFTLPLNTNIRDYINVDKEPIDVIQNVCNYICLGHTDKSFIEEMKLIQPHMLKRYLAIRTPETDKFLRTYGDGKKYTVRLVELLRTKKLPLDFVNKYKGGKNSYATLLALCTDILTNYGITCGKIGVEAMQSQGLYIRCIAEISRLKGLYGVTYNTYAFRPNYIESIHLIDTLRNTNFDEEMILSLISMLKTREDMECVRKAVTNTPDIETYLSLNLSVAELLNVLFEISKLYTHPLPCNTFLDLAEIRTEEVL